MLKDANDPVVAGAPAGSADSSLSSTLLARMRTGERAAWDRLVELYGPVVYAWCRARRLQAADAADVGQEVFAAVAAGLERFRRDCPGDSFRGWLRGITQHKLADFWRRRVGQPEATGGSDAQQRLAELPADDSTMSQGGGSLSETKLLLQRALELVRLEFEGPTWRAFWRVVVEGQASADVAGALGMTCNAVYVAKSRVLRRLREEFGDLID
jgi:RNA polymerase sigma-70 factor (ECF subfamily)